MTWAFSTYLAPYVVALLITAIALYQLWRNRQLSISQFDLVFILTGAAWIVGAALEVSTDDLVTKIIINKAQYAAVAILPVAFFVYVLQYTGNNKWVNFRTLFLLGAVPAVTLILAVTNEMHGLAWRSVLLASVDPFMPLRFQYGLGFWVFFGYTFILLLTISFLLILLLAHSNNLYRRQVGALLFFALAPWISGLLIIGRMLPYPYTDLTPLALASTSWIMAFSIFQLRLGDIVPVAREVVVESMSDGVIVLDGQNRIVDLNPVAQYVIGRSTSDLIGQRIDKVWSSWPSRIGKLHDEIEIGREVMLDTWYGLRTFDMLVSPIIDWRGHLNSRVVVLHDVSDRKLVEDELRNRSERLEELVDEKTRQLRAAERMAAIGETASMVGHDLRNPLQTIVNLLYLAKNKVDDRPDENGDASLQSILHQLETQTAYMDKIVSDLQDYSKPMSIQPSPTKLRQLIEETISAVKVPENIKLALKIEKGSNPVMIDPALMKRVFINLIVNAVQSMPEGGDLSIRSTRTDEGVSITVKDSGVGISPENLEKVFRPLFTTKSKGQGFGLPVCKRIVEAHGGSISVESEVGKGSSFIIRIPLQKGSDDR